MQDPQTMRAVAGNGAVVVDEATHAARDMSDSPQSRYVEEKKKSRDAHRPTLAKDLKAELSRLGSVGELPGGARVLDVGCGLGEWTNLLAAQGYEAHGLDFSPEFVEEARSIAKERGSNAVFTVGSAEAIPYGDGFFDAVVCNYMLEHAADWRAVVREIGRVVKPGGLAFLSTCCVLHPYTDEVTLPLYPYYPGFVKRRVIRLALTKSPHLVHHSPTPAVNWLMPGTLKREFARAGFGEVKDAFDVVQPHQVARKKQAIARIVLPVLRRVPLLKTLAYFGYPALKIYAVKR